MKKSEDTSSIILRYYETSGKKSRVTINLFDLFKKISYINAIEMVQSKTLIGGRIVYANINPYEIQTLELNK